MRPSVLLWLALPAASAACSPSVYTPPARVAALDTPGIPNQGGDVQVDVGGGGAFWGPTFDNTAGRARFAVNDSLAVEGEAGVLHVTNDGTGGSRDAYTGRAGLVWHTRDARSLQAAAGFGAGGGWSPAAGKWTAFDVTGGISAPRTWPVRPFVSASVSFDRPFDNPVFTVTDPSGDTTNLRLTPNQIETITLGLDVGSPQLSAVFGLSMLFVNSETDGVVPLDGFSGSQMFVTFGAALRYAFGGEEQRDPTPLPAWVKSYIATPDQNQ